MTIADLVADAYREIGVAPLVGDVAPAHAALALRVVNRLLDSWNAVYGAVYAEQYSTFVLQPGQAVHTIGPSGLWVMAQRPVAIEALALVTGGPPSSYDTIYPRDRAWYLAQTLPGLSITHPTYFYYNPTLPNGEITFDGVPSAPYSVRVQTRVVFASVLLTDELEVPQGYWSALHDSLKEELVHMPMFSSTAAPEIEAAAAKARGAVFGTRIPPVRLESNLPGGATGGSFDYQTRTWR